MMNTSSGTMLITGGAGFIGVNAARYFEKKGWDIIIFDNFSRRGTRKNIEDLRADIDTEKLKIVEGDIVSDIELLQETVESSDVVLHLAAQVAVTTSIYNPREDFEINALGSFNVLEAIRSLQKKPILLYASTNKVYGDLKQYTVIEKKKRFVFDDAELHANGIDENEHLNFHSPYGCSKGAADQYVLDYSRIYKMKTVVFRQSCIYGPHQFGIEDQGWVAWFLIAISLGLPLTIYGTGKQVRDVLFVDDLNGLYNKALENIEVASGKVYNVGGGPDFSLSLLELLELLKADFNLESEITYDQIRPGDQPIFISDTRQAMRDLNWEPTTIPSEGLSILVKWIQENRDVLESFHQ